MAAKNEAKRDPKKRRKSEEERKQLMVHVRVTPEQRRLLADAADRAGLDVSSWLRSVGIERARRDLGTE